MVAVVVTEAAVVMEAVAWGVDMDHMMEAMGDPREDMGGPWVA